MCSLETGKQGLEILRETTHLIHDYWTGVDISLEQMKYSDLFCFRLVCSIVSFVYEFNFWTIKLRG